MSREQLRLDAYRAAVAAADGTTKPTAASALFAANPGARAEKVRVYVETTGSPAACTIRPYARSGGTTGHVGSMAVQTLAGTPNFDLVFDVQIDGDDLAVFVETLSGGSSPTISIFLSWR